MTPASFYSAERARRYLWSKATPKQREQLLRDQATPAELALDKLLAADPRTQGRYKFQAHLHSYYVDFLFKQAKLVVEVDGSVHSSTEAKIADARRTRRLTRAGYRVLRFWNGEVLRDGQAVMRRIVWALVGGVNAPVPAVSMDASSSAVLPDLDQIIINTRVGSRRRPQQAGY